MHEIKPGRYRHYKGNEYSVLGVAKHSESLEELVVYRPEYGEHGLWVRPKQMFSETVMVDGQEMPRFRPLASQNVPDLSNSKNIFADLLRHAPDELFTTLLEGANLRIERIVSHGHTSPEGFWYDQDQHEWVLLLTGAARLRFEGDDQPLDMKAGDFIHIVAHVRHRVDWTTPDEPTVWLAVYYGA